MVRIRVTSLRVAGLVGVVACGGVSVRPDANEIDAPDAMTCITSPGNLGARWRAERNTSEETGAYDGVATGGVTYTLGRHGDAFRFNGTDGVVTADPRDELYPSASFSVEAWVNTFSTNAVLVSKHDAGGTATSGSYWALEIGITGVYFAFRVNGVPTGTRIALGPRVDDGNWHHIVGVRDVGLGQHALYVDGTLAVANTIGGGDLSPITNVDGDSDPLTLGAARTAGNNPNCCYLLGAIDEVAYYERALTAPQVAAIHAALDGICR